MCAAPVPVPALAAMRTAAFACGAALPVTMGVRLAFAVVLTAVAVAFAFAMMMRVPFAVVLTAVALAVTLAVAVLPFARAVRVGAAMAAFGVRMSLAVMRAVCLCRILKRTGEVLCNRLVRRALDAGVDADAG